MLGQEVLRLYAVADDNEAAVLDDLGLRAGLLWKCPCGWLNVEAQGTTCDGCGGGRGRHEHNPRIRGATEPDWRVGNWPDEHGDRWVAYDASRLIWEPVWLEESR